MVRIKERYLLVNIVYPEAAKDQSKSNLPDLLVYNQPTTNNCNGRTLHHAIKAEVATLFGDYGAGAVERSLRGLLLDIDPPQLTVRADQYRSQISIKRHINLHFAMLSRALPPRLGGPYDDGLCPH